MPPVSDEFFYAEELREMAVILELINYRPRTIESYLTSIAECCEWLYSTYRISINDASVPQLRAFLIYLHRPVENGGRGMKPRSVNIFNCAIKRYFKNVLRKELDKHDLPTMKVDNPLPKVPSKKEILRLLEGTKNPKHRLMFALAYGCALRLSEVISLRCGDISFPNMRITIRAENSKNRCEETVEIPETLKDKIREYYLECIKGAGRDDWLFPGQKPGTHISKGTPDRVFRRRMWELGWASCGYTFHSLRHAHALHYYLAGADIYQVQVRLRHKNISSTTVYVRLAGHLQERRKIENPFDDPIFRRL